MTDARQAHLGELLARITEVADPLIEAGHTPFMVRAHVAVHSGIMIGPGGHGDPCGPPVCRYCGGCANGGHGFNCPGGAWARDLPSPTHREG